MNITLTPTPKLLLQPAVSQLFFFPIKSLLACRIYLWAEPFGPRARPILLTTRRPYFNIIGEYYFFAGSLLECMSTKTNRIVSPQHHSVQWLRTPSLHPQFLPIMTTRKESSHIQKIHLNARYGALAGLKHHTLTFTTNIYQPADPLQC